jgi:hypothetical protein
VNRSARDSYLVAALLVGIAVAARWLSAMAGWSLLPPNFTPVAAVGLFAGYLFASRSTALLVPMVALAISNLALDSYPSVWIAAVVYGSFALAPLAGRWLRGRPTIGRAIAAVILPATFFFFTTNLATWLLDIQQLHSAYAANLHGLMVCYARGIPFFRWMLEGDIFFSAILFSGYALVTCARSLRAALPAAAQTAAAHATMANSRC